MEATYNRERYEKVGEIIRACITKSEDNGAGIVTRLADDLEQLTDETLHLLNEICKEVPYKVE